MTIEVFNYKKIDKGMVVGSFSIRVKKWKDFCIFGLTLFSKGSTRWISLPANKVEKEGKTSYYPYCGFSEKELNETFKKEILKSLEEYLLDKSPKKDEVPF